MTCASTKSSGAGDINLVAAAVAAAVAAGFTSVGGDRGRAATRRRVACAGSRVGQPMYEPRWFLGNILMYSTVILYSTYVL